MKNHKKSHVYVTILIVPQNVHFHRLSYRTHMIMLNNCDFVANYIRYQL